MANRLYDLCLVYQRQSSSSNAFQEVSWIITHVLGCSSAQIHTKSLSDFSKSLVSQLQQSLVLYAQGVPCAYIVQSAPFYNLEIIVKPGVLIPRRDTECLVDAVLSRIQEGNRVLELGVGSGAVSCAIAHECKNLQISIIGIDRSRRAIEVAQQNVDKYDLSHVVTLQEADWYDPISIDPVDIIVSNPPYIALTDQRVSPQVKEHEPGSALFSEADGLADIEHILRIGHQYLKKGGQMVIEHGDRQQDQVVALFKSLGYSHCRADSHGELPRVVSAVLVN